MAKLIRQHTNYTQLPRTIAKVNIMRSLPYIIDRGEEN
jgi:hypothetical protein